jgi:hypothetical protein
MTDQGGISKTGNRQIQYEECTVKTTKRVVVSVLAALGLAAATAAPALAGLMFNHSEPLGGR